MTNARGALVPERGVGPLCLKASLDDRTSRAGRGRRPKRDRALVSHMRKGPGVRNK